MRPILIAALFALIASSPTTASAHCSVLHTQPTEPGKPKPKRTKSHKDHAAVGLRFARRNRS